MSFRSIVLQAYREALGAKRASHRLHTYSSAMRREGRPFEKHERQKLITSIVTRRRVGTQHELLDALSRAGCQVTQATISRDIRELGLDKTHDVLGRPRYVVHTLPAASILGTRSPVFSRSSAVASWLRRTSSSSTPSSGRRQPSRGPSTGSSTRASSGTIAGDDTCLAVAANGRDAALLARELGQLVGLSRTP